MKKTLVLILIIFSVFGYIKVIDHKNLDPVIVSSNGHDDSQNQRHVEEVPREPREQWPNEPREPEPSEPWPNEPREPWRD